MYRIMSGALMLAVSAGAQAQDETEIIAFEGHEWTVFHAPNGEVETGEFNGRDALYISRGQAWLAELDLADMVIEYDFAATHQSGFLGANFRANASGMLEQFYVRPHQSEQPDATQYQPIINGISSWQIHADANDAQPVALPAGEWTRVRIVAIADQADIYVGDMETPLLHVPDLRIDGARGAFGLFMSDRPWMSDTGTWFSAITVRAATADDRIIGEPRETSELPHGVIGTWRVSAAFEEAQIAGAFRLPELAAPRTALAVEPNGIANLARLSGVSDGRNSVAAEFVIDADAAGPRLMRFGYSDRIRLFVNGDLVFDGNAGWRARDHRHLGTIGFNDAIALDLRAGENRVTAVVSESFGGWGVTAAIADQSGLRIRD